MKKLSLLATAILITVTTFAQTKWAVDPMHSSVNFEVQHLGIAFVSGHFDKFKGNYSAAKEDLSDAQVDFTVQTGSVNTGVPPRDQHLQSDDFFGAATFPEMKFKSTAFKKTGKNEYALTGNLTIKDVTRPVTFKVVYGGVGKDMQGNAKTGFKATATINRLDYHVNFDPSGQGVGKEVEINLNLEFAQAK